MAKTLEQLGEYAQARAQFLQETAKPWWEMMCLLHPQELLDELEELDNEAYKTFCSLTSRLEKEDPEMQTADFMKKIGITNRCIMEADRTVKEMYCWVPVPLEQNR